MKETITLKAFANSSPGLRSGNPGVTDFMKDATLKGLRSPSAKSQLLQSCEESLAAFKTQGFKANPGLELANAFSVNVLRSDECSEE